MGMTVIAFAKSFPLVKIDSVDSDSQSINNAKRNVSTEGLEKRISFYQTSIENFLLDEKYDLVMTFESIHDMPFPIESLRKMKSMVSTNGTILIGDVKMGDRLEEKKDFTGKFYYNFSVLLCLPQSMAFENSKATGAAMTPSTFIKYVNESGFSKVEPLPIEHFMWKFYRLTP
jgi:2-polyprenyl-3-methyl-5-hydroxy-6-metoxy-1,4-benzoquinol methylase